MYQHGSESLSQAHGRVCRAEGLKAAQAPRGKEPAPAAGGDFQDKAISLLKPNAFLALSFCSNLLNSISSAKLSVNSG